MIWYHYQGQIKLIVYRNTLLKNICLLVNAIQLDFFKHLLNWFYFFITIFCVAFYLFIFKNYFNWRLIILQYCGGFCHTFTWISHGCTCVPQADSSSHLPPHPISQGHPSALSLSALFHVSNLDWSSISHMVIYMFQCYCLKSAHLHLLP